MLPVPGSSVRRLAVIPAHDIPTPEPHHTARMYRIAVRLRERADHCSDKTRLVNSSDRKANRPRSTIQSFVERDRERGTPKNLDAPGRPQKIDDHTRRRLVRETQNGRRQPLRELRNGVAPGVSVKTVNRVLKEVDIKKWRAKKRALLTAEHAAKRLTWAKVHKDWDKEEWEGVIFSEECSVEQTKDPR
jgi:hypothetical protein